MNRDDKRMIIQIRTDMIEHHIVIGCMMNNISADINPDIIINLQLGQKIFFCFFSDIENFYLRSSQVQAKLFLY